MSGRAIRDPLLDSLAQRRALLIAHGNDADLRFRGKMLASMLAMSAAFSDLAAWRARVQEDERVQQMLAADASRNNSGEIVESWLSELRAVFGASGRALKLVD